MMDLQLLLTSLEPIKAVKENKFYDNNIRFETLYALSKNGSIRKRWLTVTDKKDHAVLITYKQINEGKITKDFYEYWEGVNIGKSNETSYIEQALAEANSIYNILYDKGFSNIIPNIEERWNVDASGNIKPMLASPNVSKIIFPCLAQPKFDGVRCLIIENRGKVEIISRTGKPYIIPHLQKWAEQHKHLLPLDGELYNHGDITFQQIISAVKKVSPLTEKIRYAVYDRPIEGVENKHRWKKIISDFEFILEAPAYRSDYVYCDNLEQLHKYHDQCIAKGYEGVMVRNFEGTYEFGFRSTDLIKYKEFDDSEFKIVGIVEATGRDSGTAVFVCAMNGYENDIAFDDSNSFRVKPQGTHKVRKEYFDNSDKYIGKLLTVQYQGLTDMGKPRFPSGIAIRDYE